MNTGEVPRQLRAVYLVGWFLLLASEISFGSLLSEAGYRSWLYFKDPARFFRWADEEKHPSMWFFQHSVWQFHAEFGYTYVPNMRWQYGYIQNGTLADCYGTAVTNEFGNVGLIPQPYREAQVDKIQGDADVAAKVDFTISGVEQT